MESKKEECNEEKGNSDTEHYESDAYFEPIVHLPLTERFTLEEDEDEMIKLRAKLFRFDSTETPSAWKERGTGEIKLLHHSKNNTVRIVMRRDKTLKICANHFITPSMKLQKPNNNRKNWWMWSTGSDFADEVAKPEIFAIKFSNEENADLWKAQFVVGQNKILKENCIDVSRVQNSDAEHSSETENSSESELENSHESVPDKTVLTNTTEELSKSVVELNISK